MKILKSALGLALGFSFAAQSRIPPSKDNWKAPLLIEALKRGDTDRYREIKGEMADGVKRDAFYTVDENGDTLLHLLVRLEGLQETKQKAAPDLESFLFAEISEISRALKARRFLRLLSFKNKQGLSALDEAIALVDSVPASVDWKNSLPESLSESGREALALLSDGKLEASSEALRQLSPVERAVLAPFQATHASAGWRVLKSAADAYGWPWRSQQTVQGQTLGIIGAVIVISFGSAILTQATDPDYGVVLGISGAGLVAAGGWACFKEFQYLRPLRAVRKALSGKR